MTTTHFFIGAVLVVVLLACSDGTGSESEMATPDLDGSGGNDGGSGGNTASGGSAQDPVVIPATVGIVERSCAAGVILLAPPEDDRNEPNRTIGANGTFVDGCRADVLVSYVCAAEFVCDPQCSYVTSGEVGEATETACGTGCVNGACLVD